MFNDEEPIDFKKMHEFSPADGFVEITENMADMIKFVANEPSVGLFYVQHHTQNAAPNLIKLKNTIFEKSHETSLHTEDLEDSITMVKSMKECGSPIADEMIKEIKKTLSIISTKQPKRGLIHNSSSGFLGRSSSWSPASWGRNAVYSQSDGESSSTGYLSSVFKSTREKLSVDLSHPFQTAGDGPSLTVPEVLTLPEAEIEDLPLTSENENEFGESQLGKSLSNQKVFALYENYDEFKADQESKLEEWLGRTSNEEGP